MNRHALFLSQLVLLLASLAAKIHAGSVVRFLYEGDSLSSHPTSYRQSISTLTNWPAFPNSPTYREQWDDFFALSGQSLNVGLQGKDNSGTDYGSWIRGYLEAPETGDYRFGLASADNSEFWLSTNHLPTGKVLISPARGMTKAQPFSPVTVWRPGCPPPSAWRKPGSTISRSATSMEPAPDISRLDGRRRAVCRRSFLRCMWLNTRMNRRWILTVAL